MSETVGVPVVSSGELDPVGEADPYRAEDEHNAASEEEHHSESVDSAGARDAAEHLKDAFKTQE